MEPIKVNLYLVGEIIALIICAVCFYMSFTYGTLTLNDGAILGGVIAVLCAVESEQRNAD